MGDVSPWNERGGRGVGRMRGLGCDADGRRVVSAEVPVVTEAVGGPRRGSDMAAGALWLGRMTIAQSTS